MFPLRSVPPSGGPPETEIVKVSLLPGSPLSVTFTVKVHGAPLLVHLSYKGVEAASTNRLERTSCGEVTRIGSTCDVGVANGIHTYDLACVCAAPAEISRVDKPGACRIQLRHEAVIAAAWSRVEGPRGRRNGGRIRHPDRIGADVGVQGDDVSSVHAAAG